MLPYLNKYSFSNHTHYIWATRLLAAACTLSEPLVGRTAVQLTYKRAMALWIGITVALVNATFFLIRTAGICIIVPSRGIAFRISRGLAWRRSIVSSCRSLALRFQYNIYMLILPLANKFILWPLFLMKLILPRVERCFPTWDWMDSCKRCSISAWGATLKKFGLRIIHLKNKHFRYYFI